GCGLASDALCYVFSFSSRRRHTRFSRDWSSDVCSSDLDGGAGLHHYEERRSLEQSMLEFADRELKAGATVGQLAAWTGLTPEVFRRRARALGVERKRPPTVGKLARPASSEETTT